MDRRIGGTGYGAKIVRRHERTSRPMAAKASLVLPKVVTTPLILGPPSVGNDGDLHATRPRAAAWG